MSKKINDIERRFITHPVVIRRDGDKESRTITGYAALFNIRSKPLFGDWFDEEIMPGAFDNVLKNKDTVARVHHDDHFIIGKNLKNLRLSTDEKGLKYEVDVPNTTAGNDLLENIRAGIITESSFAFTIEEASWKEAAKDEEVEEHRTIIKIKKLYDVAQVVVPAYEGTTIEASKRSYKNYVEKNRKNEKEDGKSVPISIALRKLKLRKLK